MVVLHHRVAEFRSTDIADNISFPQIHNAAGSCSCLKMWLCCLEQIVYNLEENQLSTDFGNPYTPWREGIPSTPV